MKHWRAVRRTELGGGGQLWRHGTSKASIFTTRCCAPVRYPHRVRLFNQIAQDAAARHGVSFLDTAAVTRDVLELSFDGSHYGDPASLGLALEVEHWLETALRADHARRRKV